MVGIASFFALWNNKLWMFENLVKGTMRHWGTVTIWFISIPEVIGQWFNYRNLSMSCLIPEIVFNAVWLSCQMQKSKNMAINEDIEGWWETMWRLLGVSLVPVRHLFRPSRLYSRENWREPRIQAIPQHDFS